MKGVLKAIHVTCLAMVGVVGLLLLLTVFPVPGLDLDARVVQSGSMHPSIKTGSIIFVTPAEEYLVDDIITFRRSEFETPTTHRIVEIKKTEGTLSYVTKGDANEVRDMEEVGEEHVMGLVRFQVPYIGHAITFAREPLGFFLLIVIPAFMIGGDETRKIVNEVKKRRKKDIIN